MLALFSKCTRSKVDQLEREWAHRILNIVKAEYALNNPYDLTFKPNQAYIIMSNHVSHYDIPLVLAVLPGSIRMVAKKELSRFPVWGQALKIAEFIFVDRNDRKQAFIDLEYAKLKMQSGIVVWMAPEGTRSRSGELQDFKKGGFMLALQTKAIIIPVGLRGTRDILPADTWDFGVGKKCEVHVGEPIDTSLYDTQSRKQLIDEVHHRIKLAIGQ